MARHPVVGVEQVDRCGARLGLGLGDDDAVVVELDERPREVSTERVEHRHPLEVLVGAHGHRAPVVRAVVGAPVEMVGSDAVGRRPQHPLREIRAQVGGELGGGPPPGLAVVVGEPEHALVRVVAA